MSQATMLLKPFTSAPPPFFWSNTSTCTNFMEANAKVCKRLDVVCLSMLTPRKFMQRRKKVEVFKDSEDEADQKNWRQLMNEIEEVGSAITVLRSRRSKSQPLPKDLLVGTLVRFKQLKKWRFVSEILEWLRTQNWWSFSEMDFLMLMTAYGKLGNFIKAERVLSYMKQKGYPPSVISYTALMEAYGKGGEYSKAEAVFRNMQSSGPEPSAVTYQIILRIFVEGNRFQEAEEIFESLLNKEAPSLKPDQKMFNMMIYMHKKARNNEKARKTFAVMAEQGIERTTITYNSLMSYETNYKEVANVYDQFFPTLDAKGWSFSPDVVSYTLLINAYGKARREEEALAVFEDMLNAGIRPTQKAYNILLNAFALCGMVEQARIVFKSMRRDRCSPDLCSYTTMLSSYVNASDMEGAEKFFRRIKQDGIEPNVVTYGTLLKGYAKVNSLEKMMEKYEEMRLCGIQANETIYTTIMEAHGKSQGFDSAVVWYNEMISKGVLPDKKAKNILLSLAGTAEEKAEANLIVGIESELNDNEILRNDDDNDDDEEDDDEDDDITDSAYDAEEMIRF